MAEEKNYGLLIAALVAVVAIVGLVLFSSGGRSGAVVYATRGPVVLGPQGGVANAQAYYMLGKQQAGPACSDRDWAEVTYADQKRCCSDQCTTVCDGVGEYKVSGRTVDPCHKECTSGCVVYVDEATVLSP